MNKLSLNEKFINEITKIKEPEVFLGVARILKVSLVKDTFDADGRPESRDFEDICADVIISFANSERQRKRELLKLLEKANKHKKIRSKEVKDKEVKDASRTENTEEDISNEKVQ